MPYKFYQSLKLPAQKEELYAFLINPDSLEKIMPPYLSMKVVSVSDNPLTSGTVIVYRIKRMGIALKWVTLIPEVKENEYLIDQGLRTPFKYWYHRHILKPIPNGTEIIDDLDIVPPLGFLGKIAWWVFLKRDFEKLFSYRSKQMEKIFGVYHHR